MKKNLLFIINTFLCTILYGQQNIIQNGSFEQIFDGSLSENALNNVFSFSVSKIQSEESDSLKEKKNFIELELMGRGFLYSINYGRLLYNNERFGVNLSGGYCRRIFNEIHDNSFPFLIDASFGKKMKASVGLGAAFLFDKNGTKLSREHVLLDSNGNFIGRTHVEYVSRFGWEHFFKVGVSYEFFYSIRIALNYYRFNFYNYTNLETHKIGNYFGVSAIKLF